MSASITPISLASITSLPLRRLSNDAAGCDKCRLCEHRSTIVLGSGNTIKPRLTIVCESPGDHEDLNGIAYSGVAGEILDDLLEKLEINRESVYATHAVMCRPPGNRPPAKSELDACYPFLEKKIESVDSQVILAIGRTAGRALLRKELPLVSMRNQWHDWNGIPMRVTYSPVYIKRNPYDLDKYETDLLNVMGMIRSREQAHGAA